MNKLWGVGVGDRLKAMRPCKGHLSVKWAHGNQRDAEGKHLLSTVLNDSVMCMSAKENNKIKIADYDVSRMGGHPTFQTWD